LDALLARCWYHEVARTLQADPDDEALVAKLCNALLPTQNQRRARAMASYREGTHLPSVERKGPGIVAILGRHLPSTLQLTEHALWVALNPDTVLDSATANRLLASLDTTVTDDLKLPGSEGLGEYYPALAERVRTSFPRLPDLAMDYVACYLILYRQGRTGGNPALWSCALDNLAIAINGATRSPQLGCLGDQLEAFVRVNYLPPEVGPRVQHPDWPFYCGGPLAGPGVSYPQNQPSWVKLT
jgi:hypothetical protein